MRELHDIPTRYPSVILDNNLKVLELAHGDCVKGYVEEDKRPLEEGVNSVCCKGSVAAWVTRMS